MGQIKHYNNGKWTIYTSGEDLSGYTGTTDTYYIGVNNTDGDLSKVNPDGELINLEKPNVGFTGFTYEIGEYVASEGGVVYHRYLSGDTQYYLVVDTQNLSLSSSWSNVINISSNATSQWNGQSNTNLIVTQSGATNGAAFLCTGSANGGKTDWYLPTIQELNKLFINSLEVSQGIDSMGGTQMSIGEYWSSTEYTSGKVFIFSFYTGYDLGGNGGFITEKIKNGLSRTRSVRKFSI